MRVRTGGREGEAVEWNPLRIPSEVIVRFGPGDFLSVPIGKVEPLDATREQLHDFLESRDPYGISRTHR